jgi:hypothetical protein
MIKTRLNYEILTNISVLSQIEFAEIKGFYYIKKLF